MRVPGTAVFMVPNADIVPPALLHNLKHNKVLHERVVLMKVETEDIPHVPDAERIAIRHLDHNFHAITVRYGFMDEPNIPRTLAQLRVMQFRFNLLETSFFVGREKVVIGKHSRVLGLAQAAVHPHAPHDAERDRIFPHPLQPRGRAGRPGRDLSGRERAALATPRPRLSAQADSGRGSCLSTRRRPSSCTAWGPSARIVGGKTSSDAKAMPTKRDRRVRPVLGQRQQQVLRLEPPPPSPRRTGSRHRPARARQ